MNKETKKLHAICKLYFYGLPIAWTAACPNGQENEHFLTLFYGPLAVGIPIPSDIIEADASDFIECAIATLIELVEKEMSLGYAEHLREQIAAHRTTRFRPE